MRNLVYGVLMLTLMVSCNEAKETKREVNSVEDARNAINEEREKLLNASGPMDVNRANNMITMYLDFVKVNPDDPDAPEFVFQAASICMAKGDYKRSIKLFGNLIKNYPDQKRLPEAYFLTAFIYDTYLDKKGMAEEWYKKVIQYYPRHDLAIQSRAAIDNLTLSDEELIKKFEEKNK